MPLAPGLALVPVGSRFPGWGASPGSMNGDLSRPPASTRSVEASPLQTPTTVANLYVRKTGSDSNGGSSNGTAPDRTGTDGVTNGTTTFTSATGAFTGADVNKLVNIVGKGRYRIVAVGGSTSVTLSGSPTSGSSLTWNLGGAVVTIGALLQVANTPAGSVLGGDRIWIGAGVYRETILVAISPTFEVLVSGDFDGSMTGDPGEVRLTGYLTSDTAAPSPTSIMNVNSKSYLTFQHITFDGGTTATLTLGNATNIIFRDCFVRQSPTSSTNMVTASVAGGATANLLFERCILLGFPAVNTNTACITFTFTGSTGPDYDANIMIRNCVFIGQSAAVRIGGTAVTGKGGGVRVYNCTMWGQSSAVLTGDVNSSSSIPAVEVLGCVIYAGTGTLTAQAFGQVVDRGFNIMQGAAPSLVSLNAISRLNVTWFGVSVGQEMLWGGQPRMPFSPSARSPLLGFGGGPVGADLLGGPRPAGGGTGKVAAGALEYPGGFAQASSPVPPAGTHVATVTGAGYQDFLLPVSATSTTVSVSVQRDANYTGPLPALELLQNGERGIAAAVAPASGPAATWETLTLPTFAPTSAGWVTLRLHSQDTSGISVVAFANVTVT